MFTPIQGILPLSPKGAFEGTKSQLSDPTGMFSDIFQHAIENVKETDAQKNQVEYLLATGQLDNPAELTIASTKAQTSVELLVQLRSKALEAYNELMRINL